MLMLSCRFLARSEISWKVRPNTRRCSVIPWPDTRLWIQRLRHGTSTVTERRGQSAVVAFDVYSRKVPGTREVNLGGLPFFAFVAPRLGAKHHVVWRRIQDVQIAAKELEAGRRSTVQFDSDVPVRVTRASERNPLTAAVWRWDSLSERDSRRYWDDGTGGGAWMYWESFWAPSRSAALAADSPAFGDVSGKMLVPLLASQEDVSVVNANFDDAAVQQDALKVVPSTATATAMKDRAYAIVYQFNVWGSDVSRSGTGSDFWSPEARLAVTALEAVIDRFEVRSMLDCACGDATWIVPYFVRKHPYISYCGCEIVPEVVEQNRTKYPDVQFLAIDLAEAPLPQGADLIFSKETLNHMDLEDARLALRRFAASGARYLLTNVHEGSNNLAGQHKQCFTTYIKYDYALPPFSMTRLASVIEYQGPRTSYSIFDLSSVS